MQGRLQGEVWCRAEAGGLRELDVGWCDSGVAKNAQASLKVECPCGLV